MYAASTAKAMNSGRSFTNQPPLPPMPITSSTAWMPTSCRAMYGIVATIPVSATARARVLEP